MNIMLVEYKGQFESKYDQVLLLDLDTLSQEMIEYFKKNTNEYGDIILSHKMEEKFDKEIKKLPGVSLPATVNGRLTIWNNI